MFDVGENILGKVLQGVQRVGQGVQAGVNAMANSALQGINRAHQEAKNTAEDAISTCVLMIR